VTSPWVEGVAIVAPGVAALGGSVLTSIYQGRQAREGRMSERRAEAYLLLAGHAVRLRQYALVAYPGIDDSNPLMPPPLSEEDRYLMFAQVEAYGSEQLISVYNRLLEDAARNRVTVDEYGIARGVPSPIGSDELQYRKDTLKDAQGARAVLLATCDEVLKLINAELRSARKRRHLIRLRRRNVDSLSSGLVMQKGRS